MSSNSLELELCVCVRARSCARACKPVIRRRPPPKQKKSLTSKHTVVPSGPSTARCATMALHKIHSDSDVSLRAVPPRPRQRAAATCWRSTFSPSWRRIRSTTQTKSSYFLDKKKHSYTTCSAQLPVHMKKHY
jgi:hypothetical protein